MYWCKDEDDFPDNPPIIVERVVVRCIDCTGAQGVPMTKHEPTSTNETTPTDRLTAGDVSSAWAKANKLIEKAAKASAAAVAATKEANRVTKAYEDQERGA
jgi:hypothetical protein